MKKLNLHFLSSVEILEARLAESNGECSAPIDQENVPNVSRPVKKKGAGYDNHTEDTYTTPIPVCPSPEYTLPVQSTEQMYFPEPSPSDHQSMEHDAVGRSSYNFAGPQLPTPEYLIAEPSEYIVPDQRYSHGYFEFQTSLQCMSSPEDPYMPMVPETHFGVAINQQPAFVDPVQPYVIGSLDTAILPDINEAESSDALLLN